MKLEAEKYGASCSPLVKFPFIGTRLCSSPTVLKFFGEISSKKGNMKDLKKMNCGGTVCVFIVVVVTYIYKCAKIAYIHANEDT